MTERSDLGALLESHAPETREVFAALVDLVHEVVPDAIEQLDMPDRLRLWPARRAPAARLRDRAHPAHRPRQRAAHRRRAARRSSRHRGGHGQADPPRELPHHRGRGPDPPSAICSSSRPSGGALGRSVVGTSGVRVQYAAPMFPHAPAL